MVAGVLLVAMALLVAPVPSRAQTDSPGNTPASRPAGSVEVVIFWEPGCPFCKRARAYLARQQTSNPWLNIRAIDISASVQNQDLFLRASYAFGIARPGVPLVVIGARPFLGFDSDQTTGKTMLAAANACRTADCRRLEQLLASAEKTRPPPRRALPREIRVPLFGSIGIADLSLPALTVLLAAVDGFNPCAMWVLIFLIGLLINMQDRFRMWLLGGVFLLTSGIVYFGFLAAWLNIFLLLGALLWVRLAVGGVALASGGYYLYSFATNAAAECKVTNLAQRRRIMEALRSAVYEKRFLAALAGIVVLAAAVNLIELLCSAGIPAVFTDIVAMSDLPVWQYYMYLLLYVAVFMLDDAIIFATAMLTLKATGLTNQYLRFSHLVGGVAMVMIGLLLVFAPDWLAFGV